MTNQEKYEMLKKMVDKKPKKMGIFQYADLLLRALPQIKYLAKYRPKENYDPKANRNN